MSEPPGQIELVDPDEAVYADYSSNFTAYNAAHATWDIRTFSCILRRGGRIVAGGRGVTNMGALELRGLWVDEDLRGTGLGTRLLSAIEEEARRRGARRAMLYTFTWQAKAFYRRMGYREYARFPYPDGPERIDMMKDL